MERGEQRRAALAMVAPGTELRDGLERIVRGNTGALIVVGCDRAVEQICSGGFELHAEFSATRLRELAKMDGAIVLDQAASRILLAAVQLVPDPNLPTGESGTRHRTAERTARQTGFPVLSVSKSMRTIAIFTGAERYVLQDSAALLARAHQELGALERYRRRLDDATRALTVLEIEDRASATDVAAVARQLEMVSRVTDEVAGYLVELGTDGGLLRLQLDELTAGTRRQRDLLARDYQDEPVRGGESAAHVTPRGYRLLGQIPALPDDAVDTVLRHFGSLQKLLSASAQELRQVPGLEPRLAGAMREGLSRIAEAALVDRYP